MTRKRDLRKVIKIFFASPGDVDKERKSFRSIIQEAKTKGKPDGGSSLMLWAGKIRFPERAVRRV
jgi:hypothetical protein